MWLDSFQETLEIASLRFKGPFSQPSWWPSKKTKADLMRVWNQDGVCFRAQERNWQFKTLDKSTCTSKYFRQLVEGTDICNRTNLDHLDHLERPCYGFRQRGSQLCRLWEKTIHVRQKVIVGPRQIFLREKSWGLVICLIKVRCNF